MWKESQITKLEYFLPEGISGGEQLLLALPPMILTGIDVLVPLEDLISILLILIIFNKLKMPSNPPLIMQPSWLNLSKVKEASLYLIKVTWLVSRNFVKDTMSYLFVMKSKLV